MVDSFTPLFRACFSISEYSPFSLLPLFYLSGNVQQFLQALRRNKNTITKQALCTNYTPFKTYIQLELCLLYLLNTLLFFSIINLTLPPNSILTPSVWFCRHPPPPPSSPGCSWRSQNWRLNRDTLLEIPTCVVTIPPPHDVSC